MPARIYRQPKPAGQSGLAGTREWVFEYGQSAPRHQDSLMGWTGSSDTRAQLKLYFSSCDDAVAYAQREHIAFEVEKPAERIRAPKVYADNFASNRIQNWTH
ncbi:ETC complex I subunit [Acetobacter tropicalis]|uniref:Oxidoreductase n=2 Tax=Acetobacter TaxID=434 RepID=A0A252EIB5_9PROT|nr:MULTISPECIES: ETC complex I subunit [Acetobacter]ATJ91031.1 oxidoreductase [Acetobacter tropicalis]MCG4252618.1 ETC complex I subunit [Acetobacter senegalensis]MCG4259304.1 ETC complex I subunit [Acetobacter senegalensis]MCG4272677.1 ETC complex I subunit [Acetobacter senegalensis]OUL66231.1 oxidoreductase [Acetobacter senegalensis]